MAENTGRGTSRGVAVPSISKGQPLLWGMQWLPQARSFSTEKNIYG